MNRIFKTVRHALVLVAAVTLGTGICAIGTGCGGKSKEKAKITIAPRYKPLASKEVPEWLKGSLFEQCDVVGTEPMRVSNYGIVVNLRGTGDARSAPNGVRDYMIREMTKRGFGRATVEGFEKVKPEAVLQDPRVALVRVDAFIPPGARKTQRVDVQVSALENSNTTSLAGGTLYLTDLYNGGANPISPGGVDILASARGQVYVNPAYALDPDPAEPSQQRSLRRGIVMNGGRLTTERPVVLRIRAAEFRLSRLTERRIQKQFADTSVASAQDEGRVFVRVPGLYGEDWQHFAGVLLHTFYNYSHEFAAIKSKSLAAEAVKPDAPLLNLSYAMEALGKPALPEISKLYGHASADVAFAAARAGAFIGDGAAEAALMQIATDEKSPYRINAVQTLSSLPSTPAVNAMLRQLLDSRDTLVRVEAYRGLVKNKDDFVYSRPISEKFSLDIVPGNGKPLIYVTRIGMPRIAFIGQRSQLKLPLVYTAVDGTFSIASDDETRLLTMFYRGQGVLEPVKIASSPDIAEVTARLAGEGPPGEPRLDFNYAEIVAMLAQFSDRQQLAATAAPSQLVSLVMQPAPGSADAIDSAPPIPEGPRPVTSDASAPAVSGDKPAEPAVNQ